MFSVSHSFIAKLFDMIINFSTSEFRVQYHQTDCIRIKIGGFKDNMVAMSDISLQSNCIVEIFISEVTSPNNLRRNSHYCAVTLAIIILLYRSLENLNGIFMLFVFVTTYNTQGSSGSKTNIKSIFAPFSIIISNSIKI